MSIKSQVTSYKSQVFFLPFFACYLLLPMAIGTNCFFSSCGGDDDIPTPKPFAYFRIDLPEKKYSLFSDSCPFEFEYPSEYALVLADSDNNAEPCWKNIVYPRFAAEVNLSYKHIDNNNHFEKYLDDSWTLATKHQVKASGMSETPIKRVNAKVYGLMFEIEGNTASNIQFYLTDSTHHFLRGALYFFAHPNYDSLSPVIDFLKKDVERMITTLKWKEKPTH